MTETESVTQHGRRDESSVQIGLSTLFTSLDRLRIPYIWKCYKRISEEA